MPGSGGRWGVADRVKKKLPAPQQQEGGCGLGRSLAYYYYYVQGGLCALHKAGL